MKHWKKGMVVTSAALLCVLAVGCGEGKQESYEKTMEEYARDYYETYILDKVEGLDVPEITIANLENVNANGGANYDLSKLEGCTSTSYVRLILAENGRDIDHVEFNMRCEKQTKELIE